MTVTCWSPQAYSSLEWHPRRSAGLGCRHKRRYENGSANQRYPDKLRPCVDRLTEPNWSSCKIGCTSGNANGGAKWQRDGEFVDADVSPVHHRQPQPKIT